MVDFKFKKKFKRMITLDELKAIPKLVDTPLLRKGNRLSIMPMSEEAWRIILALAEDA